MQISKDTLSILRNFSSINGSIMLQEGSRLATISEGRNIMAEVTVEETFPTNFGIYDLNEFLSIISIFRDTQPDLDFNDKYVLISDGGKNKFKYYSAGESIVKAAPATIKFPDPEIKFNLEQTVFDSLRKISSVLKTADVSIVGDSDGVLKAVIVDKKNPTANSFETVLGETDREFRANFKIENLKLYPGNYTVEISTKKISRFTHTDCGLVCYIAVEADSEF